MEIAGKYSLDLETHYVFDMEPVPKPRMTRQDKFKKRDCTTRYWGFCDHLSFEAIENGFNKVPIGTPLHLSFFLPLPEKASLKLKKQLHLQPHNTDTNALLNRKTATPDFDNLAKAFFDALYEEDSAAWYVTVSKYWINARGRIIATPIKPQAIPGEVVEFLSLNP